MVYLRDGALAMGKNGVRIFHLVTDAARIQQVGKFGHRDGGGPHIDVAIVAGLGVIAIIAVERLPLEDAIGDAFATEESVQFLAVAQILAVHPLQRHYRAQPFQAQVSL